MNWVNIEVAIQLCVAFRISQSFTGSSVKIYTEAQRASPVGSGGSARHFHLIRVRLNFTNVDYGLDSLNVLKK